MKKFAIRLRIQATFSDLVCQAAMQIFSAAVHDTFVMLLCVAGAHMHAFRTLRPLAGGERIRLAVSVQSPVRESDFAVTLRPAGVQVASLANKEKAFAPERSFRS